FVVGEGVSRRAMRLFAEAFSRPWAARELATAMECAEVDAFVRLLAELGERRAALEWLVDHARGDDFDDAHWSVPVDAEQYLERLMGRWS
ncbi:hypothetical protein, partial [Streptomyces alkaliterrae]|uniref:hypothetical protein n=2 Tax=Streptomyces alkaliterrae TaxID=2213162 RepID=UPI001E53EA06